MMTIKYHKSVPSEVKSYVESVVNNKNYTPHPIIKERLKKICENPSYSKIWGALEKYFPGKVNLYVSLAAAAPTDAKMYKRSLEAKKKILKEIDFSVKNLIKKIRRLLNNNDVSIPPCFYNLEALEFFDSHKKSGDILDPILLFQDLSSNISCFKPKIDFHPYKGALTTRNFSDENAFMGGLLDLMDMNRLDYSKAGLAPILQATSDIIVGKKDGNIRIDASESINARRMIKRYIAAKLKE